MTNNKGRTPLKDNKDLYSKIVKDSQPERNRLLKEARIDMIALLGPKRIGIWGPYRDVIQGVKSYRIIERLAKAFARNGFTVITGRGIYRDSIKSHLFDVFFKFIRALPVKIALKDLYKELVTYAPNAVFIQTRLRSTSMFEEESFYDNDYLDNELGVGFLISEDTPLECSKLLKQGIDEVQFWLCDGTIPKHCKDNVGKCPFYDQGINYSTIDMFVISGYMKLAITTDYHHIHKIMKSLINMS